MTALFLGAPIGAIGAAKPQGKQVLAFFGTYTGAKSKGIYSAWFNPATGDFAQPKVAAEVTNPTFLALHPNGQWLYAVNETDRFEGRRAGAVSAFSVDAKSGTLVMLNQQPSGGTGPCHLSVDRSGKCVLVANYGSGSVASFRIDKSGKLGEAASTIQHQGSSINPQRQAGPHAHHIVPDPGNRFVLACDLGLDQVLIYQLDPAKALLTPHTPAAAVLKPGAGPRHLDFHPKGRFVYVLNELDSTLTTFAYDRKAGALTSLSNVSTLLEGFAGKNSCAEIQVHPSGKFVYCSNRGDDSIAIFATDSESGIVMLVGRQSTRGQTPRHFTLDPSGRWLIAENQGSDQAVVFKVDPRTGLLEPTDSRFDVGAPVCLVFVP